MNAPLFSDSSLVVVPVEDTSEPEDEELAPEVVVEEELAPEVEDDEELEEVEVVNTRPGRAEHLAREVPFE